MKFFFIGFGVSTLIALIYTHDLRGDRNAARKAFEDRREQIRARYQEGWQIGFQAGCNTTMSTIGEANQKAGELTTNTMSFIQSNIVWCFNLQRPK